MDLSKPKEDEENEVELEKVEDETTEEDITQNPNNPTNTVIESMKTSFKIAFEGCSEYIKEEEIKLSERSGDGGRDTRSASGLTARPSSISVTSSNMFQTFGDN